MTKPNLTFISLGWGVQSWTLAAMVALGDLPPVDLAIHADTTHEAAGTYAHAEKWTPWLGERGVKVVTVTADNTEVVRERAASKSVKIPAFTLAEDSSRGQIKRDCTYDWKIKPIRRHLRQLLIPNPKPGAVECWQGISVDEWHRMRDSDVRYIINRYPLVERPIPIQAIQSRKREIKMGEPSCRFHFALTNVDNQDRQITVTLPFDSTVTFDVTLCPSEAEGLSASNPWVRDITLEPGSLQRALVVELPGTPKQVTGRDLEESILPKIADHYTDVLGTGELWAPLPLHEIPIHICDDLLQHIEQTYPKKYDRADWEWPSALLGSGIQPEQVLRKVGRSGPLGRTTPSNNPNISSMN